MIEQQGRVASCSGQYAEVLVGATSGCPACDAGKGCGAGIFGRMLLRKPISLKLDNQLGVFPGQLVVVGIPEKIFLALLLRIYLLPLLAGLAGAVLGHYLGGQWDLGHMAQDMLALGLALIFGILPLLRNSAGISALAKPSIISMVKLADVPVDQTCEPGPLATRD